MKRRLNVLCVIVMLVLSYSVLEAAYYLGMGFKAGIEMGVGDAPKLSKQKLMNMKSISVIPKELDSAYAGLLTDSVYNEKSGTYVPSSYVGLAVSVDTNLTAWEQKMIALLSLLNIGVIVWAITLFLRLVIAINKSDIFNWKNVRRLRRLGLALILGFCATLLEGYITFWEVKKVFALPGYSLNFSEMINTTTLVLGIASLIVAEVFAIGLKMKEEQELTI